MGNQDIWDELERAGTGEFLSEEMFEYISAYADGECNAKERRLVEAYVAENADARQLLADLRAQSAFVAEGQADPPAWLRAAILDGTSRKRTFRWPAIAGLSAATVTAAIVAVAYWPSGQSPDVRPDVLASNVQPTAPKELDVQEIPVQPERAVDVPEQVTEEPATTVHRNPIPKPRRNAGNFRTVSATIEPPKEVTPEPETVPVKETPSEPVTYAVVDYGNGRFQPQQPDPVDASATQPTETAKPAPRPEVLPDARQRLRDRVRKLNEEKIQIGEKENRGS